MKVNNVKNKTKECNNKRKIITVFKWTLGISAVIGASGIIIAQKKTIDNMSEIILAQKKLLDEKDNFFKGFIARLLKEGNSDGARQMAYRRYWLEKQNAI